MTTPIPQQKFKENRVNRAEQINEIRTRLNAVRLGRSNFDCVLDWYGIPGIGKTTLGKMIANLCQEMGVHYARVDFDTDESKNPAAERVKQYADMPVSVLEDLILALATKEPATFKEALDLYEQTEPGSFLQKERRKRVVRTFRTYVQELSESQPVVLLFDTTDKASESLIDWLEEHLISPLALTGHVLIVWLGRYPQRWKRFEVRRRAAAWKLEPLLPKATIEQVGPVGDRIYHLTQGHPLGNKRMAQVIEVYREKGQKAPDRELIDVLVDQVIDEYVMPKRDVDSDLNAALRNLAIVRQFDVVFLQRLLPQFVPAFKELREALFLEVLSRLASTYLVEWDRERKGYALDTTLRRILALHLRHNHPEQYRSLNKKASKIYAEWIGRIEENRSIYITEYLYHRACLARVDKVPTEKIVEELKSDLKRFLAKHYKDRESSLAQKATQQLLHELDGDDELREMLGDEASILIRTIEFHLNSLY